jgi:cell division protein FtsB
MQHMNDGSPLASPDAAAPGRRRRRQTAEEVRSGRRSIVMWCLSILFAVLAVGSVIGENGYIATLRARKEERDLLSSLARIRLDNQRLQHDAARLREDPAALEEAARRELGFVRPGEALVIVRDARPTLPPAR